MKFTLITPALVAVLGLALSSAVVTVKADTASTSTSTTTTTSSSTMKKIHYKGTVTAVDTTANSVTVHNAKGDVTLAVSPETKFGGSATALTDIAVGDKIAGSFTKAADGKMSACSLNKHEAKVKTSTSSSSTTTTTTPAAQ